MNKEIIAEYTYKLPLPTDEEIRSSYKAEGIEDIDPNMVRDYIKASMYKLFCEIASKNKQGE